jgi:hypothetical protein
VQFSGVVAFALSICAWVAEKIPPLKGSCMCVFVNALSWHDEHTAAVGEVLRLSTASLAAGPVVVVVPRIPFAVGGAQRPVSWYDVPIWQAVQFFSLPGKTTVLKSFTPPEP